MVKMEKTEQVINALRNKYPSSAYAFLTQVGNSTGWECNRWADVIVMSLWPSRGLEIIGFEIKVSRQDWVKELKHPDKADTIANYCDSWYLVLGDEEILQFGELPMGWGLMVPQTKKTLKVATESKRSIKPKLIDKNFLASILRQTSKQLTKSSELRREYNSGYSAGIEEGKERLKYSVESKTDQIQTLKNEIKDFENASGVDITDWRHNSSKIGDAVKIVLDGSYIRELENLESLQKRASNCTKSIEEEIRKHKEVDTCNTKNGNS